MVSRRRVAGYGRQVRLINSTDRQRLSGAFSFACTRLGQARGKHFLGQALGDSRSLGISDPAPIQLTRGDISRAT